MHEKLPPGITLIQADDFQTWLMDIQVIDSNPIYQGETYRLKFSFSPQYPIEVRMSNSQGLESDKMTDIPIRPPK